MDKFIFDANVLWDLEEINMLDKMMNVFSNMDLSIHMSRINYIEMPTRVRSKLRNHKSVININEPDEIEYDEFRKEIRNQGIVLDGKDSAVLYTCNQINADYIVSSDTKVRLESKKYAEKYIKSTLPFHLLDLLKYLHKVDQIDSKLCINMALDLYKNKELPHMIKNHGGELIEDITKRQRWISENTDLSTDIFNSYGKHIVLYSR